MARKRFNLIPGRGEMLGGAAVVAVMATVYLVRGGPEITTADSTRSAALRSPDEGGPERARMKPAPSAVDAAQGANRAGQGVRDRSDAR